jgi:membrane protease YdiL (CAAX protease family)
VTARVGAARRLSSTRWTLDRPTVQGIRIIGAYSAILVLAELVGATWGAIPGAMMDAVLIPVLLAHYVMRPAATYRRLLPILALLGLLRTLSITAVFPHLPVATWYSLVGAPVLIGAVLAIRLIDEPFERLGLRVQDVRLDAAIVVSGLPLGLVGYVLLRPEELVPGAGPAIVVLAMAALAVFAAFTEELVYRGLLQTVAIEAFGFRRAGVVYAATMCAFMYAGSGSPPFMLAMWGLSLGFGFALVRGASLWGLAASHALILWGMGIFWPRLLG